MRDLSFCITCKNRFEQLYHTLPRNLHDNYRNKYKIEFVLADFDNDDKLQKWILLTFADELKSGYLKYFYTNSLKYWHSSIAKNTAHFYSSGKVLVNLDCDNFTGSDGGNFVLNQFEKFGTKLLLHQFSGQYSDGSYGRISMLRRQFFKIGGYDESFLPMAYQDKDIILRLSILGLEYHLIDDPKYNKAILNSKVESIANTNTKLSYLEMQQENRRLSMQNIYSGKIVSNNGTFGIRRNVYQYVKGELIQIN